jgi:hypothetical protein
MLTRIVEHDSAQSAQLGPVHDEFAHASGQLVDDAVEHVQGVLPLRLLPSHRPLRPEHQGVARRAEGNVRQNQFVPA